MQTGSIIMSFFATIWWIIGALNSGWPPIVSFGIPIAIFIFLFVIRKKEDIIPTELSEQEGRRIGRLVGIASGAEGIIIFVVVNILANIGKSDLLSPIIAIIVGLHFIPLARWIPAKLYYYTALLLVVVGTFGLIIFDSILRLKIVCFGSALTLWATSYIVLRMSLLVENK
jgi:tetrahydromethanopterin S-methyltransferase subunit G